MDNLAGKSVFVCVCERERERERESHTQFFLTLNQCRLGRLGLPLTHPKTNESGRDPVILKLVPISIVLKEIDSLLHSHPLSA